MRSKELHRNINLAFKRFHRRGNLMHFDKCQWHLEKVLQDHLKYYQDEKPYYEEDLDDIEKVKQHVCYIADRWDSIGRIRFLLEVIKRGYSV